LERRRNAIQAKLDRGYEDLLAGTISQNMWTRNSAAWESELETIRDELRRLDEQATTDNAASILELSQRAYSLYMSQERTEQRRLLKALLSNCTLERGSLMPTYSKPFDLLVQGNETGEWLGGRDSNPDYTVQSRVSYH
jgi:site-specific DNA recombinase